MMHSDRRAITQPTRLVGYILSEDPTYITTYNNARSLIRRIDRDELLQILGQILSWRIGFV